MGVKRNFAYSSILTVSSYFFPLLTYPYVSRVIGVNGIGICNFVDSLINYFVLFSMMGISACGIREIAMHKSDGKISKTFSSIFALNAISTAIAAVVLVVAMYTVESLAEYRTLLYVGLCKLLMNLLLVEWLFKGLEDFAYVTKRTLAVKCLYVASVFIFIQSKDDYALYYVLSVGMVVVNALINSVYARRFVHFTLKDIEFKPYLPTYFSIGIYLVITSFYTSLNVAWLGFATDTVQVGYYTTSTRLYTIIISFFTAFTNVMFPRLSALLAEGKMEEFWSKIEKSVEALYAIAFPLVIISLVMGPQILHMLVGDGFEGAYLPFRIIVPLILIIGYEQILVMQILLPMKHNNTILRNAICGATLALILNLLIVTRLGAVGSACVWLSSEILVLILSHSYLVRSTKYTFSYKKLGQYVVGYMPLLLLLIAVLQWLPVGEFLMLLLASILTAVYTLWILVKVLRNEIVLDMMARVPLLNKIH